MLQLKNDQLIKSASYASVTIAMIIMVVKFYGWTETDSQSILASLVDACLDISSSLINLIAVRIYLKPPDKNHRFGHDKFQDLAIFSQSMFFFASCVFILASSIRALYFRSAPENLDVGVDIMVLCIFLTFILVTYQTYVIKRTGSKIIMADKVHYFSDFLSNIAVVLSLYFSQKFWYIDAVAGIGIALYIMYAAYSLFKEAISNLSDEEFSAEDRVKILKIVSAFPETKGVHELKTRSAANKPFIQFHLELDGEISLLEAHRISDMVEEELMKHFKNAEIIIHQDPEGVEEHQDGFKAIEI
jgi:cation diffusion facilitator family transporter